MVLPRSRLLYELCDLAIDFLAQGCAKEDARDVILNLKSCSLVCKAWLPRTSMHLFRHISVGRPSLTDVSDVTRNGLNDNPGELEDREPHGLSAFLAQANSSPRLVRHTKEVTIHSDCGADDLTQLFTLLPHLEQLNILDNTTFQVPATRPPRAPLAFEGTLHLQRCYPHAISRLLSLFAEVLHLYIHDPEPPELDYEHIEQCLPNRPHVRVHNLTLEVMDHETWVVLQRCVVPESLCYGRFLSGADPGSDVDAFAPELAIFLSMTGRYMKHLSFDLEFLFGSDLEDTRHVLRAPFRGLSAVSGLQTLCVIIPPSENRMYELESAFDIAASVLQSVPPSLHNVAIRSLSRDLPCELDLPPPPDIRSSFSGCSATIEQLCFLFVDTKETFSPSQRNWWPCRNHGGAAPPWAAQKTHDPRIRDSYYDWFLEDLDELSELRQSGHGKDLAHLKTTRTRQARWIPPVTQW